MATVSQVVRPPFQQMRKPGAGLPDAQLNCLKGYKGPAPTWRERWRDGATARFGVDG
jgi:hypothetical protein